MENEINRVWFTPKQASAYCGITVAELRYRIKYLKIPVSARKKSFVVSIKKLPKIIKYTEDLKMTIKRLEKKLFIANRKIEELRQHKKL